MTYGSDSKPLSLAFRALPELPHLSSQPTPFFLPSNASGALGCLMPQCLGTCWPICPTTPLPSLLCIRPSNAAPESPCLRCGCYAVSSGLCVTPLPPCLLPCTSYCPVIICLHVYLQAILQLPSPSSRKSFLTCSPQWHPPSWSS